jgi:hypothetical protein
MTSVACRYCIRLAIGVLLWQLAASSSAQAGYAYKAEHGDGSISYSDTPPSSAQSVKRVRVDSGIGESQVQGQDRLKQLETYNRLVDEEKVARDEASAQRAGEIAKARAEVADAERALQDTLTSKKSATPERIHLMENQLKLARQRLREVQSGAK